MKKVDRLIVTPKWMKIKEMYETGTNGSEAYGTNFKINGELDKLGHEFLDLLGEITNKFGYNCIIEGVKMDLWKERIWSLIENAGLLPEISWRDDKESDRLELENAQLNDDFGDLEDYEPSDEELLQTEMYS